MRTKMTEVQAHDFIKLLENPLLYPYQKIAAMQKLHDFTDVNKSINNAMAFMRNRITENKEAARSYGKLHNDDQVDY